MTKGLKKKFKKDHNIDWVDSSSRSTYIFDLYVYRVWMY